MAIKYYHDLVQGSDEWIAARRGILTASEMNRIITPAKLKYSESKEAATHLYELLGQRVTGYVEPHYISDDMLRGHEDELRAKILYNEKYAGVQDCGFITNDKWGFTLGYSPDGLIGDDGQIECKSRLQKYQIQTLLSATMPIDFYIQVQTGLAVSERLWTDFISYCGGLPMMTVKIFPDPDVQNAIIAAATTFHANLQYLEKQYRGRLADSRMRLIPTERPIIQEITL